MDVKRWTPCAVVTGLNEAHGDVIEDEFGFYVLESDYDALRELCAEVIRARHHELPGAIQALEDRLGSTASGGADNAG